MKFNLVALYFVIIQTQIMLETSMLKTSLFILGFIYIDSKLDNILNRNVLL